MKKSITRAMTIGLILVSILSFIRYKKAVEEKSHTIESPNSWAIAAHFYLDGKGYFYNGKLTYELPEGYEYVGEVINVGDSSSDLRKDFEGNVDGKIYLNPSISDTAYFSWADSEWNEEVDGPKPFLKLEIEKKEFDKRK